MPPARQRLLLFLGCAVVLLGAGYGWGYASAHDQFYAPESLLEGELTSLNFNNRLLHYANINRPDEARRELLTRLHEQLTLVENLASDCHDPGSRREADKSVQNARQVMSGQSLVAGASTTAAQR